MVSPDADLNSGSIVNTLPSVDVARQAVDSLRGYAYQAMVTALAWLDIDDQTRMFLEVAEDYATVAGDALHAVQVKDTRASGRVTLSTQSVRDAIATYVDLVHRNPNSRVDLRFFTTSEVGKEQRRTDRPGGLPGLEYWRQAAGRGNAEMLPLRRILESDRFPESVREFSRARNDTDLRRNLVQRIHWDCGQPVFSMIREQLEARLVVLGRDRFSLPAQEARRLVDILVYHVLQTSFADSPESRVLTRATLYDAIDAASSISVPRVVLELITRVNVRLSELLQGIPATEMPFSAEDVSWIIPGTTLTVLQGIIPRASVESDFARALDTFAACVLVGASGVGKSSVSQRIAATRSAEYSLVEFRNIGTEETRRRLDMIFARMGGLSSSVLMLDDLNHIEDSQVRMSIARLVDASRRRERELIITCYRTPTPTALTQLNLGHECVVMCDYFSEDEVDTLVKRNGGNPSTWGRLCYIAGGQGHPQLSHALVTGLAARGWPPSETADLVIQGFSSRDTEATRDAARRNLVSALPEGTRNLLYRLSMGGGRFDRALALTVGGMPPRILQSGECMDQLVGPWLESVGTNLFRVSPLAANFGREVLSPDEQRQIHDTIATYMLGRGTISAGDTNAILVHALAGESTRNLARLGNAVWRAKGVVLEKLAEQLYVLRLMPTSRPIYRQDLVISILLRIAQFKLVAALGDGARIRVVAATLLAESETLPEAEYARPARVLALISVLGMVGVGNYVDNWIGVLARFRRTVEENSELHELFVDMQDSIDGQHSNLFAGLFNIGSAGLESVERLEHVVTELDKVDAGTRTLLLSGIDDASSDHAVFVNGPWAKHEDSQEFDAEDAAVRYARMAEITRRWSIPVLSMQCSVAYAVILDEYRDQPTEALDALNDAMADFGNDVILLRAVAKVHLRRCRHEEALDVFSDIADSVGGENPVERAFALRDAAIAAARSEKWTQAEEWFAAAQTAAMRAELPNMNAMAIGLGGDAACAALQGGATARALGRFADAMYALESIDPGAALSHAFCHHAIRQAVVWAYSRIAGSKVSGSGPTTVLEAGDCSSSKPAPGLRERPLVHIDVVWYLLAETEVAARVDAGIAGNLNEKLTEGGIPVMEAGLRGRRMEMAIAALDARRFAEEMLPYYEVAMYALRKKSGTASEETLVSPSRGRIPTWDGRLPPERGAEKVVEHALVGFGICAAMAGDGNAVGELADELRERGAKEYPGRFLLENWERGEKRLEGLDSNAFAAVRVLTGGRHTDPGVLWNTGVCFFVWIENSHFGGSLFRQLGEWQRSRWREIATNERFRLSRPRHTVPELERALAVQANGRSFVARLLLVASDAVAARLDREYRRMLEDAVEQRGDSTK